MANETQVIEHADMWAQNSHDYMLVCPFPGDICVNNSLIFNRKSRMWTAITDDTVSSEVKRRMAKAGVPIVSSAAVRYLFEPPMGDVYLIRPGEYLRWPRLQLAVDAISSPVFELVYHHEDEWRSASLIADQRDDVCVAFWYWNYEVVAFGEDYYRPHNPGPCWVSIFAEDSNEFVSGTDGQGDYERLRMFYGNCSVIEAVFKDFMQAGRKCGSIKWEIENTVINRVGATHATPTLTPWKRFVQNIRPDR